MAQLSKIMESLRTEGVDTTELLAKSKASGDIVKVDGEDVANKGDLVDYQNTVYGNSFNASSDARGHKAHAITICKGVSYRIRASVDLGACYLCSEESVSVDKRLQQICVSLSKGCTAEFTAEYNCGFVSFYWADAGSLELVSVSSVSQITDKGKVAFVGVDESIAYNTRGWKIFPVEIYKGAAYKLKCRTPLGVTTICSIDNATDPTTNHRVEVFNTELLEDNGEISFTTSNFADYIAIYFVGAGSVELKQDHTIASCEKSINNAVTRLEFLENSALNYSGSVIAQSNDTQNIYGIEGISLKNGRTYSIGFFVGGTVTNGNYITVKITNEDGSIYKQLGAYMRADVSAFVPGQMYSFDFKAVEDKENVKIGSYAKTATMSGVNFTFFCTDITEVTERAGNAGNDATNAAEFYPKFYEFEIAQLKKDSDVVFAYVSDLHHANVNLQRVIDVASEIGADAVLNCGDTVTNLNSEGLEWYNSIVAASSIPVLTVLGNHDGWHSSNPWVWSTAEANYNLIMPTLIDQAGVIAQNGKCYWYKDFGNLRVIGLDGVDFNMENAHHWDDEQSGWFENLLSDSRINGKKVLVMNHYPFDKAKAEIVLKGWNSWDTYLENYRQWDSLYTPSGAVSAVKKFIDAGGSFIGWFVGHQHRDSTLICTDDNRQLMSVISSGSREKHPDSAAYGSVTNRRYDCFNLVGIDLTHGFLKMLRCGLDEDSAMQIRKPFTWDYVNHRILGG